MTTEGPDYSGVAASYSVSRLGYPPELFAWLASLVSRRDMAWDSATGNGQAAVGLAPYFDRVIATDQTEAQILHAKRHPRVEYRVAQAEVSGLPANSVDLVVVAAALHWFDQPRFYKEVTRVTRSGGILAAWTYHVAHVEPPFDKVLWPFYRDIVGPYFMEGAHLVDDRYQAINLPGLRLDTPSFIVSSSWTGSEILRFVRTWSGVQSYIKTTGKDPTTELESQLEKVCGSVDSVHQLCWPVYLRASRL